MTAGRQRMNRCIVASCILLFLGTSGAWGAAPEEPAAELLPLWEAGLFVGAVRLPQYPGSDEYSLYALPLPYLIYRGEMLRANRDGIKGIFLEGDRFETGLSFSGNPPVDEENDARRGMPKVGAILEGGPVLKYFLRGKKHPDPLYLALAVRAAISISTDDLDLAYQGLHGDVRLIYHNHTWLKKQDITIGMNTGVDFTDRRYNQYFYEVASDYATDDRPEYDPDGGYAGFSTAVYANKKLGGRWLLACFYRWATLSGAAFEDSPLVKTDSNHIVGMALLWNIHQSVQMSVHSGE